MLLPGGLWRDGERHRNFAFRPLTGEIELALADCVASEDRGAAEDRLPARVSRVLAAALGELGGERSSPELVSRLAVGDRQFLVRQLAAWLGRGEVWLTAPCGHCAEPFDFFVEQSALPVKEAGDEFPFASAETSLGCCRLRLPTGADQQAIAGVADDSEAIAVLARRCLVDIDGRRVEDEEVSFTGADLEAVSAALEESAPEVGSHVRVACPECGEHNEVGVDPYLCLAGDGEELFAEIHLLASVYHWNEAEILALPRHRRQRYLELVEGSRGVAT